MHADPAVVVVGGGVVGASVAYHLACGGAQVTLVEAATPASGTSGASFSASIATRKTPRSFFDLAADGQRDHDRLADELGECGWLGRAGALEWAHDEREREVLRERVRRLDGWGHPAEWITADTARGIEPHVAFPDDEEIAHYPGEQWYDAVLLAETLLAHARRHGARVITGTRVVAVDRAAGAVRGVRTSDGGAHPADVMVDCAGPAADSVAALAGASLPLVKVPGLVADTVPMPFPVRSILFAPDVNVRPAGGGALRVHAYGVDRALDPQAGATSPQARESRALLAATRGVLPGLEGGLRAPRIGVRPIPADGLPAIGPLPGADGCYAAVTHSGANLAPIVGRLAAGEILGRRDPRLDPFRPQRFSDRRLPAVGDESFREMSVRLAEHEAAAPSEEPPTWEP